MNHAVPRDAKVPVALVDVLEGIGLGDHAVEIELALLERTFVSPASVKYACTRMSYSVPEVNDGT